MKFCLRENRTHWTVQDSQTKYDKNGMRCYWGLGFYELNKSVEEFRERDFDNLNEFVEGRELFLVRWNWIDQFPAFAVRGETDISSWEYVFRYPKRKLLPKIKSSYEVEGGIVHLTQGIRKRDFSFLESGVPF